MRSPRRQRLLIPMLYAWSSDLSLTLWFQPDGYWHGDYSQADELITPYKTLLEFHPAAFVAGSLANLTVYALVALFCPLRIGRAAALFVTVGHMWGASSWIWMCLPLCGYWIAGLHLIGCALLTWVWDVPDNAAALQTTASKNGEMRLVA